MLIPNTMVMPKIGNAIQENKFLCNCRTVTLDYSKLTVKRYRKTSYSTAITVCFGVLKVPKLLNTYLYYTSDTPLMLTIAYSVTRLGDLLDFGQLFKGFGNNYFAQILHILRQFL